VIGESLVRAEDVILSNTIRLALVVLAREQVRVRD
jgi:hypothetical protein